MSVLQPLSNVNTGVTSVFTTVFPSPSHKVGHVAVAQEIFLERKLVNIWSNKSMRAVVRGQIRNGDWTWVLTQAPQLERGRKKICDLRQTGEHLRQHHAGGLTVVLSWEGCPERQHHLHSAVCNSPRRTQTVPLLHEIPQFFPQLLTPAPPHTGWDQVIDLIAKDHKNHPLDSFESKSHKRAE